MRPRILFSHKLLLFCLVTFSLLFCGVCFNVADAISTGKVAFKGSEVSANIPKGAHYQHDGPRKVASNVEVTTEGESRRVVLAEKWKEPLGKAPDITIFTFTATAWGQGRILLTLNRDARGPTSPEDVGGYRGLADPHSIAEDEAEKFTVDQYVPHENIRDYEDGFDSPYDDDCVPVKHKGYNLEVVTGEEDLDAVGKAYAEKISIAYGTERSAQRALGLTGGWGTAAIEADFVHGTKRTWGWNLVDDSQNYSGDTMDSSFRVTVNDSVYEEQGQPQGPPCEVCDNCGDFVHNKNDHYLGLCPLDPNVSGCGEKRWSCETSKQKAWHQIRFCYNSVTVPIILVGGPTLVCPERFRHCNNPECDFRIKRKRGHSDGTQSDPPPGTSNLTAESHLIDPPATATATLTSSDGSSTTTAGSSFTVNVSLPTGYTLLYWYIKAPGESGYGTSVSNVSGDGSSTTASYTYSLPSGASGDYVLTAYAYLSDSTIAEPTYTVSVSSGGSSTPAPTDNTPDCSLCTSGCSACDTGSDNTEAETTKICTRWVYRWIWNDSEQRWDYVYEVCGGEFTDNSNAIGSCTPTEAHQE